MLAPSGALVGAEASMVRILSIDGGGIRGVIPGLVLAEIERIAQRPIADLFDVVAGTSTGGILACGLCAPGDGGRPKFSAAGLVDMYVEEGARIFPRHHFERLSSLVRVKYPTTGIEAVLREYVGESMLSEALTELFVTAYDLEGRKPKFFRRRDAREHAGADHPLWMVARSTSAAPTYFEPFKLPGAAPGEYEALVDGGVFANNPALCAYVDGSSGPGQVRPDGILLVSLGTGAQNRRIPYQRAKDWGKVEWASPILDVVFDGVSATTEYQLAQILAEDDYVRLQTELTIASDDMDDTGAENLKKLREQAEKLIATEAERIAHVCARAGASTGTTGAAPQ